MWTLDLSSPLPLWRADAPEDAVRMAFSTRRGGVSAPPFDSLNLGRSTADRPEAVTENRLRVIAALELESTRVVTAGQVHGANVVRAVRGGHEAGCDALLTTVPGLALAVTTADCMSLIYTAPGAIAVVHSGWRGTAAGMPRAALSAVCEAARVGPERVKVHFGPCIRACCYEVGAEVAREFPARALAPALDRFRLDLPFAARSQLADAGLPTLNVTDVGACTACQPEWYFSHRHSRGIAGRHWAIASLRP